MSDGRKTRRWKGKVKLALAGIIVLDLALAGAIWHGLRENPQAQAARRDRLAKKEKLLAADVARGQTIEKQLPLVKKECDEFYQQNLLPSSSGYTTVVADLGEMAKKAGVTAGGVSFGQSSVKGRDLSEVSISAQVQGSYAGLIRLISDLEQSPHFYVLDSLMLTSATSGSIRLSISLRTYFRT